MASTQTTSKGLGRGEAGSPGFLRVRWRAEISLAALFWRDMMVFSTLANLVMLLVSLLLLETGLPDWVAMAAFLSPMPWNVFIVACVFRAADRRAGSIAFAAKLGALSWLVVATLL